MRRVLPFLLVILGACSSDYGPESDKDAELLGSDVGLMITESSAALDAGAIEAILPGSHRRVRIEGFGLGSDMQLRRVVGADGRERIFTLHADSGTIVERNREGSAVAPAIPVFEKEPSRANPLDLALAPDGALWISRHGERSILVIAADGGRSTIDLSAFADDDGIPDMSALAIVGDVAYVALRRLEKGFGTTKNTSTVVAIDVRTRAVTPLLELPAKDPGAEFLRRQNELWISCIGGPLTKDASGDPAPDRNAALVRIDLAARSAKVALSAAAANGFVTAFDIADESLGYAIVAEFEGDNPTSVVRFDPSTGTLLDRSPWARTTDYRLWDLALLRDKQLLLVADRNEEAPGVRILSTTDGARLGRIPTRLLPIELLVLRSGS